MTIIWIIISAESHNVIVVERDIVNADKILFAECIAVEISRPLLYHAGQVFPFKEIIEYEGIHSYGEYTIGDMNQIVSSGLTGWGWGIRNEGKCEYVLININ